MGLAARLDRHLRDSRLLEGDHRLLVALSGGLDSVCLLHALRFGAAGGRELRAAHLDHAMRHESGGDAAWVRGLCRAWDVPLHEGRTERPARNETDARELRYTFLEAAADAAGADAILTAHHADDQAETLLFRMIRGTGVAGLAGIPARRGRIARPLLPFTREELLAYARREGIRWREDRSNRDLRFARNRLRHHVLPELEAVRPGAARRIAALAERAAAAESAWRALVRQALDDVVTRVDAGGFELARDRLLGYHPHVRARVLRHLLQELGCRPGRAGTRVAMEFISAGASGSSVEFAGAVRMDRNFDAIRVGMADDAQRAGQDGPARQDAVVRIEGPGAGRASLTVGGQRYEVRWTSEQVESQDEALDCDLSSLRFPLQLRGARPGDRMRLPYGSKKLKKLFQERRVPRPARDRVPVLCDADGVILWAVGVARSAFALPVRGQPVFTITVGNGESV